jgi:hypothetical protein
MPSYDKQVVHSSRYEWIIRTYGTGSVSWVEVSKAIHAAHQELVSLGVLQKDHEASDNSIVVSGDDESVRVSFTIERDGDSVRLV